jgi:uncharacterized protein YbjT (DUF2867 family)
MSPGGDEEPTGGPDLRKLHRMNITVVGASGLIGTKVVELLTTAGHDVTAASRSTGVDVLTGDGLAEALAAAGVLIDVTNSPSFADDDVLAFFTTSTNNLVAAAREAGVTHYVALSIVGIDDLPDSGYLRAKVAQEKLIVASGLPYSIVRATQFQEFAETITGSLIVGAEVRVPDGRIQPIAADDVAAELARIATSTPLAGIVNIGGPDKISFADLARVVLARQGDDQPVIVDPAATYFGTPVGDDSLVTGADGVLTATPFI